MRELGLDAFRFSIAWPRVLPEGRGRVNEAGLDFYDRLVDELLAHDIEPFATLFHWDTPQALEDEGGWPARSTAEAFVEYAEAVVGTARRPCPHWMTHNEPWVYAWIGHAWGEHAPGRTSEADAVAAAHHLLLSHGWAVGGDPARRARRAGRDHAQPRARVSGDRLAGGRGGRVAASTATATAGSSTRSSAASYPADLLERNELVAAVRPRRRPRGDRGAARLPRRQQLLPLRRQRRRRRRPRLSCNRRGRSTPTWAGRSIRTGCTACSCASPRSTRRRRSTSPRTAPRSATSACHDGRVHDPERTAYLESHIDAVAPRGRGRRAGQGLLRLEPARQLRVGARLLEAVRDRLHRLPDARARAEGQLLLVPRLHREPARARRGRRRSRRADVKAAAVGLALAALARRGRGRQCAADRFSCGRSSPTAPTPSS